MNRISFHSSHHWYHVLLHISVYICRYKQFQMDFLLGFAMCVVFMLFFCSLLLFVVWCSMVVWRLFACCFAYQKNIWQPLIITTAVDVNISIAAHCFFLIFTCFSILRLYILLWLLARCFRLRISYNVYGVCSILYMLRSEHRKKNFFFVLLGEYLFLANDLINILQQTETLHNRMVLGRSFRVCWHIFSTSMSIV